MDTIDRQLIEALRLNGRSSWAELGRIVGLSGPSVQERVRRLEERGLTRHEALRQMLVAYAENMHANAPVHTWPFP